MHLLIPAAGMGRRMGSERNKLLLSLENRPLLAWTLLAASASQEIDWIGIIGQSSDFPDFREILIALNLTKPVKLIEGGNTRQKSVYNGLQALPAQARRVLIHDGARCLATSQLFDRCARALQNCQGLIAAIPVKDTIKIVDENKVIKDTPKRSNLWAAQTPQGFEVSLLKHCHDRGLKLGWKVTDDAALFEMCKLPVTIVEGEETNLKVTTPVDLAIAEFILRQRLGS
ncbi:MAG: 2-C-methyl-D-erythritol 4-phosphate cytidylyltransferase [Xenococcaceae cyanobacterium MO_188.B32]|nr:2-C-methyl-D-erythritol 4-phosphate cytidylyltransferase [Xenococcaceae cyanobacterium MO_188.B32]